MAVLYNDTLPGVSITVPDEAVPIHELSGWHRQRPAPNPEPGPVDYTGWLKADLAAEAESRGLDTTGTKDELIARLDGNDVSATEPEEPAE